MEIPSKFDSRLVESKWYAFWQKNGYFKSVPDDRKPYTIVMPPPNVTGVLHMGHMLNNSLQDIIIRRARMRGYNACWVPGTDHASIATEAKVVAKLKAEGIDKSSLTRETFLEHAWDWTHDYGGVILEQLKKLGCSCDWDRTKFTLDPEMSESVLRVFIDLYNKGLIYRGFRMVNWDPEAQTTLSDEEVIYEEKSDNLYHIAYQVEGSEEQVIIATTRPETLLGDSAVCIHPEDERYFHLKGKEVWVPLTGRKVPIIQDEYVTMDFGTGCLKVTPAHDINDKALGEKHGLDVIDIFNANATLNLKGLEYEGLDRFVARKKIVKALDVIGALVKTESHVHKVGRSERTKAIIEPRLSDQWFLKMDDLAQPAINAVLKSDDIALLPDKFKNTYRHWMENIRDWNISRQLWWGQRIPAYYFGTSVEDFVVALTAEEALEAAQKKAGNNLLKQEDLRQDEDVLDTWFSSWLWPITVFDGIRNPENDDINYYYPTQDLVTGPDILFFWVARMIVSGYEYRKQKPFSNVYLTGLVRDEKGRKMSKQLGNSPDALKLIEDYGAFDVKIRDVTIKPSGETELFMPISLNGLMDSLSNKDERKYLTECNDEFIEETGLIKVLKSSDMFLRPGNLARGVYDLCIGGDEVTTPLRYDINYRNYILVTEGEIKLMLSPPKSGKYLFKDLDYENLEFRSPINPWMVQEHYKHDFDKVKCLELTVKKGDIIYIPAYWWYSIKYLDNSTCIKFKYTTYMNFVAIIPELCMNLLQNQNIKRVIAPQLELNNYKTK